MRLPFVALALVLSSFVHAETVVTACDLDTGAGVNLKTALQAGGPIRFACPAGTAIKLTGTHAIGADTTLDGEDRVTLDASGTETALSGSAPAHAAPKTLELKNLTISGGKGTAANAVIKGRLNLTLSRVTAHDNSFLTALVDSRLDALDSIFLSNRGRVLSVVSAGSSACSLRSLQSRFDGNGLPSVASDGASAIAVDGCRSVSIEASQFRFNEGYPRGAVTIASVRDMTIRGTLFEANKARELGGAISLTDVSRAVLSHVTFRGNQAGWAAALFAASSDVGAHAVAFVKNTATRGGAVEIRGGALQASRAFLIANLGGAGSAALDMDAASQGSLANVIVARNRGGEAAVRLATGAVMNGTIVDNQGIGLKSLREVSLVNTVVAGNRAGNCLAASPDAIRDHGSNVEYPQRGCPGSFAAADPLLDEFFVPAAASLLYRTGDDDACFKPPVSRRDAYGQTRPRAGRCTIGAVEGGIERIAIEYLQPPR